MLRRALSRVNWLSVIADGLTLGAILIFLRTVGVI